MNLPQNETELVRRSLEQILGGGVLDEDTLYAISDIATPEGVRALRDAAAEVTVRMMPRHFDSCSIVNARSGRCSEDCKWCAQSGHYSTGCRNYTLVDAGEVHEVAAYNSSHGVGRFSLVASGRAVKGQALSDIAVLLEDVRRRYGIDTCASLGLIGESEMQTLARAGVRRYHCNMETAPSYFGQLCSTHTQQQKLQTVEAAYRAGMEVCSGGIIGMGETRRQRMELAIFLRQVNPVSIPINVLCPIEGTPLQDMPPISDDEVIDTVAMFRMAHPGVQLRLAGGRARFPRPTLLELLRVGINGAIVGDLLTTIGSTIAQDKALAAEAGYEF